MNSISMAKISIMVGIAFFAILFAVMVILLNYSKNAYTSGASEESYRVGLIMNGVSNDRSWGQSHYDALSRVTAELGAALLCRENVDAGESFDETVRELAETKKCSVIVAAYDVYSDRISETAGNYPEVYFLHAAGTESGKISARSTEECISTGISAG